jgi:hypothetical protein
MPYLYARQNPFDDARNTLSSWDNCMAKNYCKCVSHNLRMPNPTHTQQMASDSRNYRWRSHPSISRVLHSALCMLRRRMHHLLL